MADEERRRAPPHHLADLIDGYSKWRTLPVDPKLAADPEAPARPAIKVSSTGLPRKIVIAIERAGKNLSLPEIRSAVPGAFSTPRIKQAIWRLQGRKVVWCIGDRGKMQYGVGPKPEGARWREEPAQ